MRLIDADALRKSFEKWRDDFAQLMSSYGNDKASLMDDVLWEVDAMPTVEAVPVVHAHWIKTGLGMRCSNPKCNCLSSLWDDNLKSTFCPWCGAKMDLEDKL